MYQPQFPNPSSLPPLLPLSIHMFVLYMCLYFCSADKIIYTIFSRFHINTLIYDIGFSLSDLLHSVGQSLAPSTCMLRP